MGSDSEPSGDSESDSEAGDFGFRPPSARRPPAPAPAAPAIGGFNFPGPTSSAASTASFAPSRPAINPNKLFTPEELSLLPSGVLDRQKAKQAAKKARKRQVERDRTEGELMYGMLGMDVEGQASRLVPMPMERKNKKERRREKRRAELEARKWAGTHGVPQAAAAGQGGEVDMEKQKEADFERFLQGVGADMDEDL